MLISQADKHPLPNTTPAYHPITRWLHAGLVLGVIVQLICAAQMAHPDHAEKGHQKATISHHSEHKNTHAKPAVNANTDQSTHKTDKAGQWWMAAHRNAGLWVAFIVLANLGWAFIVRGKPRKRQIGVLFSVLHWHEATAILKQLPGMMLGKRGLPEPGNSLSLTVEMLGMLTMTAMALTGSIIWNLWAGPGNSVSETVEMWMSVHAGFAVLLLLYLTGHVSMALVHLRAADSVFARILPWDSH